MEKLTIIPEKTCFLNIDMQNCFVANSPVAVENGLDLAEELNQFAQECRDKGILVVHTAHVTRPGNHNTGIMGELIPPVKGGMIEDGQISAALHEKIIVKDEDIVLKKPRFGAFHSTDLEPILRSKGIDTVIIGGIATNVCCETTAREANVRDFMVIFLSDGTKTFDLGGVKAEEIQKVVCATVNMFFGRVHTMKETIDMME